MSNNLVIENTRVPKNSKSAFKDISLAQTITTVGELLLVIQQFPSSTPIRISYDGEDYAIDGIDYEASNGTLYLIERE